MISATSCRRHSSAPHGISNSMSVFAFVESLFTEKRFDKECNRNTTNTIHTKYIRWNCKCGLANKEQNETKWHSKRKVSRWRVSRALVGSRTLGAPARIKAHNNNHLEVNKTRWMLISRISMRRRGAKAATEPTSSQTIVMQTKNPETLWGWFCSQRTASKTFEESSYGIMQTLQFFH